MFSDLFGSTALSLRRACEEPRELTRGYLRAAAGVVKRAEEAQAKG